MNSEEITIMKRGDSSKLFFYLIIMEGVGGVNCKRKGAKIYNKIVIIIRIIILMFNFFKSLVYTYG